LGQRAQLDRSDGELRFELLLAQALHGFLGVHVGYRGWWQLQLALDLGAKLGVVTIVGGTCLDLPLVFEVEVDRLHLGCGFAISADLLEALLLDPGLEPNLELPALELELLCSQELLVGPLHVVECEEQALKIEPLEVALSVVHGRSWEVPFGCEDLLLHLLLVLGVASHEESLVDWKRALDVDDVLVLHQRNVEEGAVEHVEELV